MIFYFKLKISATHSIARFVRRDDNISLLAELMDDR